MYFFDWEERYHEENKTWSDCDTHIRTVQVFRNEQLEAA